MLPDGNKGRDKSPTRYIPNVMERLGLYKPPAPPTSAVFCLVFWLLVILRVRCQVVLWIIVCVSLKVLLALYENA